MQRPIPLLLLLLFLNAIGTLGKPAFFKQNSQSVSSIDLGKFTTNAQRLTAGLTPLPPVRRSASRTSAARRAEVSQTVITGRIRARRVSNNAVVGFIAQMFGSTGQLGITTFEAAHRWSATVYVTGVSPQRNLNSLTYGGRYLAAIENPSTPPGPPMFAYLGIADATPPGSSPQFGRNPSGNPGFFAETAIFTYNAATGGVSVNYVTRYGATILMTILYDPVNNIIWVVDNPLAYPNPDFIPVSFEWLA